MYYFIFIQWHIVTEHVILSKHVSLQCRWQSIDLDLLKLVKEERGNLCGLHYCEVYQPIQKQMGGWDFWRLGKSLVSQSSNVGTRRSLWTWWQSLSKKLPNRQGILNIPTQNGILDSVYGTRRFIEENNEKLDKSCNGVALWSACHYFFWYCNIPDLIRVIFVFYIGSLCFEKFSVWLNKVVHVHVLVLFDGYAD